MRRLERLAVAGGIRPGVLAPVHGNRPERADERAHERHAEERGFREKRDGSRREAKKEKRVDETVRMVGDEDDGPDRGDVVQAFDVDLPEEDRERLPEQK